MKNISEIRKQNLKRFLRFLKDNNCYSRFRQCMQLYPSKFYTIDNWIILLNKPDDLMSNAPFEWDEINVKSLNAWCFWDSLDTKWRIIQYKNI